MPLNWIQSVTADQLPDPPFRVNHYTTVVDPEQWLTKIQEDAQANPKFWRLRTGVLQREIEQIRELIEGKNQWCISQ